MVIEFSLWFVRVSCSRAPLGRIEARAQCMAPTEPATILRADSADANVIATNTVSPVD
jgi:hypothetical protein